MLRFLQGCLFGALFQSREHRFTCPGRQLRVFFNATPLKHNIWGVLREDGRATTLCSYADFELLHQISTAIISKRWTGSRHSLRSFLIYGKCKFAFASISFFFSQRHDLVCFSLL